MDMTFKCQLNDINDMILIDSVYSIDTSGGRGGGVGWGCMYRILEWSGLSEG